MKVNILMIDPPEGWRHGFPKPYNSNDTVEDQLLKAGYAQEDLEWVVPHIRWYFKEENQ
jgi:hypothetical protein